MKELDQIVELHCIFGGEACDCYCYPLKATVAESRFYKQFPHWQRCRNYCIMNDLQYHKCIYAVYERVAISEM